MTNPEAERTLTEKLSGKTKRPEDFGGKKTLHGIILGTPEAPLFIDKIELPLLPEGAYCLSAADLPSTASFGNGLLPFPLLASETSLWKGQPLMAIAGPDADLLEDWIDHVSLETRKPGLPILPEPITRIVEKGDTESAFSQAFQVVEDRISLPLKTHPETVDYVTCIRDGSNYTIHVETSWPSMVRKAVSRCLKIQQSSVKIRPYRPKPGWDLVLWGPVMAACNAALLSRMSRRSVRLRNTPIHGNLERTNDSHAKFLLKAAVDGQGKVLALEADFTVPVGAVMEMADELLDRILQSLTGIYPCKNLKLVGRCIPQHKIPESLGPAGGSEIGFTVAEIFAGKIAEHSLTTPRSWRIASLPEKGQNVGPGIVTPKPPALEEMIQSLTDDADFDRKHASFEQTRLARPTIRRHPSLYRGIGMSLAWLGSGFLGASPELTRSALSVRLEIDGTLNIRIPGLPTHGGLLKYWAVMAGDILGIEEKHIVFRPTVSPSSKISAPCVLGRNVGVYTQLLERACRDLGKRRFRDALPIEVAKTRRRPSSRSWDSQRLSGTPYDALAWGVSIVEVEVSTSTYIPSVTKTWMAVDAGHLLSKDIAESALLAQTERILDWCADGGFRTTGSDVVPANQFKEKTMMVDIRFHGDSPKSPPKGLAGLPWSLIPAAYLQAVSQASGKSLSSLPVYPQDLLYQGNVP